MTVNERELCDQLEIRAARRRTDAEVVTGGGPALLILGAVAAVYRLSDRL